MSPILYAIPFFLACIGLELLVSVASRRQVYRAHDAITSINIGLISETIRSIVKLFTVVVYAIVVDKVAAFTWDLLHPAVWIVAFLMYDFFYYWAHRSGHEINLLWASHVVHHNSEDFNLATALRQSWTNQLFYWVFYLPMAIVGIPAKVFVLIALASAIYQFWVHTRLVGSMGWFDRVFVTPANHRCHHGRNPYCIDKNYGGTLIIWDRLFGTYTAERADEPVVYGTITPLESWNPVWGNFKNYVGIGQQWREVKGWRNKLMTLFAPPGWSPTQPEIPAPPPIVKSTPFDTPGHAWQTAYGVVASTLLLGLVVDLLITAGSLSWPQRLFYTLLLVCNAAFLGRVLEGKPGAVKLEMGRAVLVLLALASGLWFHEVSGLWRWGGVLAMAGALGVLWRVQGMGPGAASKGLGGAA